MNWSIKSAGSSFAASSRATWQLVLRLAVASAVVLASAALLGSQTHDFIADDEVHIVQFEEMTYPLAARLKQVEGAVVVRVTLDGEGKVTSAAALSGSKLLAEACTTNAKKWLFRPNSKKAAVLVYVFRIDGLCKSPCPSHFVFRPPNVALISMGRSTVEW